MPASSALRKRERILPGIEQTVGAELVIGRRQQLAELLIEGRVESLSDILVAPGVARQRRRRFEIAVARARPRQRIFSIGGERLGFRKPRQHGLIGLTLGDERLLAATAQPIRRRPIRMDREEGGDPSETSVVWVKTQGDPAGGGVGERRLHARRGFVAMNEVAGLIRRDRLDEGVRVLSEQRRGGIRPPSRRP